MIHVGDKLVCKKETNTQCLEMCNPYFDIKIGDEYIVTDEDGYPDYNPCRWYQLTSKDGSIVLNAWNDDGHMIVDDTFEKVMD